MDSYCYCTVRDRRTGSKYVCYTRRKHRTLIIRLTDAADVWTGEFTEDTLDKFTQKLSAKSLEDLCLKLSHGDLCFVVNDEGALLRSGSSPNGDDLLLLSKMAADEAKHEVKQLLFTLADCISETSDGTALSVSPVKNHHRRTIGDCDFEPRQQNSAPTVTVKKRLPGSSLINPGTKKKREATGVAFDDPDDD